MAKAVKEVVAGGVGARSPLALAATQGARSPAAVRREGGDVAFPAAHEPSGSTVDNMQKSVRLHLRRALASAPSGIRGPDVPVHEHAALAIRTDDGSCSLGSFKAPWSADSCKNAVLTTGYYEAGANICWADAVARGEMHQRLVGDEATWDEVQTAAQRFFSHDAVIVETPCKRNELPRVVFPGPLAVWADDRKQLLGATHFKGSLKLLSGHVWVAAWYKGMYDALRSNKPTAWKWLMALWQCGLTITFVVKECENEADAAAFSLKQSEQRASVGATADSFPAFALKALVLLGEEDPKKIRGTNVRGPDVLSRMTTLEKAGVRHGGSP